jgi:hypothetical protein
VRVPKGQRPARARFSARPPPASIGAGSGQGRRPARGGRGNVAGEPVEVSDHEIAYQPRFGHIVAARG